MGTIEKALFLIVFCHWGEFSDNVLKEWIKRWKDFNILGEEGWYNKYYQRFYSQEYITEMTDLGLYLSGDTICKRPETWRWYISHYLREKSDLLKRIKHLL